MAISTSNEGRMDDTVPASKVEQGVAPEKKGLVQKGMEAAKSAARPLAMAAAIGSAALTTAGCDDPNPFNNPSQSQVENYAEDLGITLQRRYMTGDNVGNSNAQAILDAIVKAVEENDPEYLDGVTARFNRRTEIDQASIDAANETVSDLRALGRSTNPALKAELEQAYNMLQNGFTVETR